MEKLSAYMKSFMIYLAIGLVLVSGQPVETLYIEEGGLLMGFIFLTLSNEGDARA